MTKVNSIGIRVTGLDGRPVIAKFTGLANASSNSKTGSMVQNYLLPEQWMQDKRMGDDTSVCGDCPHSFRAGDTCYLHKGSAKMGLISTMKKMPDRITDDTEDVVQLLAGKAVRFGSYGEPVLLGEELVSRVCAVAEHWTGYSHRWMDPQYQWAKQYFMASVDSEDQMHEANAMGWRTFRVRNVDDPVRRTEVTCPASKEAGKVTTCDVCGLCRGASSKAKSITILRH